MDRREFGKKLTAAAPALAAAADIEISDVKQLHISEGDAIVLRYQGVMSEGAGQHLRLTVEAMLAKHGFPKCPVLVLEEGMEIEVLRRVDVSNG